MRQCGRGGLDPALGCNFQGTFESELNLAGGFLARVSVRHDAGPFDDLGDEAFIAFFRRVPNADFIAARVGSHHCDSTSADVQIDRKFLIRQRAQI